MADFLFEIGLEEVPARMIAAAQSELTKKVMETLAAYDLLFEDARVESFSTPRRLAVLVRGVREKQEDQTVEALGPSVKVAYSKDGSPTAAAHAFAKRFDIQVADLKVKSTAKGDYLEARLQREGSLASHVITAEMPSILSAIYWAKNMYWRPGKPERFVRPVQWMVALLGSDVVPVSFGGYEASGVTFGHRLLYEGPPIALGTPDEYEDALLSGFVIASVYVRRKRIEKALDHVTRTVPGLWWREDHELVDKLTQLTEWPSVLMGQFEREYLTLPEEVLVTVMRDHQNYFAVEDKEGKLAPHFLAVLNTEADEAGMAVIRHGNERVLRARFNDARFFWEFDQRVPLEKRVELLSNLTFHTKLGLQGSYAAKIERLEKLTGDLVQLPESTEEVPVISNVDDLALSRAAKLSKSDLTTEMVREFTELQGKIGGLYAQTQGEPTKTCRAIYDQYSPKFFGDKIPSTLEGAILAIADRADTISGMFAVGLEPTGSKDPLGLRRAANGIIQILAENPMPLNRTLSSLAKRACAAYGSEIVTFRVAERVENTSMREIDRLERNVSPIDQVALSSKVNAFLVERLEFYLREAKGQAYDVVKAVLAVGSSDVRDAVARAEAVTAVRGSEDFVAVSAAFKRMKNILTQAKEKGILDMRVEIPSQVIGNPAQNALTEAAGKISEKFTDLTANQEYVAALQVIATLRPQVDRFFNEVMVMDDDPYVRNSRLSLLDSLVQTFSKIADFSEIVVAG